MTTVNEIGKKGTPMYLSYMVDFLSFLDGIRYPPGTIFPVERLLTLVPEDVVRWFKVRTFGGLDVVFRPMETEFLLRSNTLMVMKKSLSFYMPDTSSAWSSRTKTGNPTRSKPVNDFVKFVRQAEVRGIARVSQAKEALTMVQF